MAIAPEVLIGLEPDKAARLPVLLRALWYDAQGNWASAHEAAQEVTSREGAWVHAYLHRKEGDLPNASYWYQRAGRPVARGSLEEEWRVIVTALSAAEHD